MRIIILLLLFFCSNSSISQVQEPLQFWTNYSVINPSFSGAYRGDFTDVSYNYAINDRGTVQSLYINSNYYLSGPHFIGLNYQASSYHNGTDGNLQLSLAKHLLYDCRPGMGKYLNFGASVGLLHETDTLTRRTLFVPDLDIGFSYHTRRYFYGLSIKHLISPIFGSGLNNEPSVNFQGRYTLRASRKYYINTIALTSYRAKELSGTVAVQLERRSKGSLTLSYTSKHVIALQFEHLIPRESSYKPIYRYGLSVAHGIQPYSKTSWSFEAHFGIPLY